MSRGTETTSERSTKRNAPGLRPRSSLFGFQSNKLIPTMTDRRQTAAFVSMGLGKTVSTETSLLDLQVPRSLIVAPARVVQMDVWGEECRRWAHLQGIEVVPLDGSPKARKEYLHAPLRDRQTIEVVSYQLFRWLADEVDLEKRYHAIGFDELTKMKSPGAGWFRYMRTRTAEIPIRFGLTGSPRPNHLRELWGQMYAVALEKPLGGSSAQFLMQYFTAFEVAEHVCRWTPRFGAEELIFERVKPYAFHLDPADAPRWDLRVNPVHVPLPREVAKLSEDLAKDLRIQLANGADLIALSAGTRATKVRQIAGGAVYVDPVTKEWAKVHDHKLDALEEVIESLQGEPTMVAYWFGHERERILERFPHARELRTKEDERDWNAGKIEILLVHPASVGHGLNLQFGGHTIIWFTLPHSHEMWEQLNGRLARPGQVSPFTMAHILLAGATDLAVLANLEEKRTGQDRVKAATRID